MDEETIKRDIREKKQYLLRLKTRESELQSERRMLKNRRIELRDQIYNLAILLPKIENEERRVKLARARLQDSL